MGLTFIFALLGIGVVASLSDITFNDQSEGDGSEPDPSEETEETDDVLSIFELVDQIENSTGVVEFDNEGVGGLVGTESDDEISTDGFEGGNFNNVIDALGGDDTVLANGNRLDVLGGNGDDTIVSSVMNDGQIFGGEGADHIGLEFGFENEIHGDDGDDTITVTGGPFAQNNEIYGGSGDDTLNVFGGTTEDSSSNLFVSGGEGSDTFNIFTSNGYWQDSGPNEGNTSNTVSVLSDFNVGEDTLNITVINDDFFQFKEMQIVERQEDEGGEIRHYTDLIISSENSDGDVKEAIITLNDVSGLAEESVNLMVSEAPSNFY